MLSRRGMMSKSLTSHALIDCYEPWPSIVAWIVCPFESTCSEHAAGGGMTLVPVFVIIRRVVPQRQLRTACYVCR